MKANHPGARSATWLLAGATLMMLGSCAPQKPVQPAPVPAPRPTTPAVKPLPPAPPPPVDWRDAPQTPGSWRWHSTVGFSEAQFGTDPKEPRFAVTCSTSTKVVSLVSYIPSSEAAPMRVVTTGPARVLQASLTSNEPRALAAPLNSQDPLLDAIAFSRGRFMVEVPGQLALYLPSWPEISRAIEDCR